MYLAGTTIERNLWRGLAVEADFLYRRDGFNNTFNYGPGVLAGSGDSAASIDNRARLDVFELPVLAKYYFRSDSSLQPFVLTGYSLPKALANVDSSITTLNSTGGSLSPRVFLIGRLRTQAQRSAQGCAGIPEEFL